MLPAKRLTADRGLTLVGGTLPNTGAVAGLWLAVGVGGGGILVHRLITGRTIWWLSRAQGGGVDRTEVAVGTGLGRQHAGQENPFASIDYSS